MSIFLKPFFLFLFLSNYHDLCPSSSSHLNNLPQHQIFLEKIGGCLSDFPLFILPLPTIPQLKIAYQLRNLKNSKTFLNIRHFFFFFNSHNDSLFKFHGMPNLVFSIITKSFIKNHHTRLLISSPFLNYWNHLVPMLHDNDFQLYTLVHVAGI